jgi:hypothetical protein
MVGKSINQMLLRNGSNMFSKKSRTEQYADARRRHGFPLSQVLYSLGVCERDRDRVWQKKKKMNIGDYSVDKETK